MYTEINIQRSMSIITEYSVDVRRCTLSLSLGFGCNSQPFARVTFNGGERENVVSGKVRERARAEEPRGRNRITEDMRRASDWWSSNKSRRTCPDAGTDTDDP